MSGHDKTKAIEAATNHLVSDDYLSIRADGSPLGPPGYFSVHPCVRIHHLTLVIAGFQTERKIINEPSDPSGICLSPINWTVFSDARCFITSVEDRCNGLAPMRLAAAGLLWWTGEHMRSGALAEVWTLDEPPTDFHHPHLFVLEDGTEVRQAGPSLRDKVATGRKLVRKYPLDTMEVEALSLIDRIKSV